MSVRCLQASVFAAALLAFLPCVSAPAAPLPALGDRLAEAYEPEPALYADGTDPIPAAAATGGVTTTEETVRFENRNRRIVFMRPTVPAGPARAPAILMLHYSGGTPEKMATLTAVARLVRDQGVWVILPEGVNRRWSMDPVRDRYRTDDSTFLAQVIDNAVAAHPIDARRVYVVGFSLGGFMAERFACDHSERLAGAAWSSATLLNTLRDRCAFGSAMPVMTFHGTSDPRVSYQQRIGLASAPQTAAFFADRNGCLPPTGSDLPDIASDGTTVHLDTYGRCSAGKPVRFYTVNQGGHTWPGTNYQQGLTGRVTHDIDATLLLWDFLKDYSR
ncbi:MAG: hypothetical protein NVS9B10_06320 [Nevskia sp.]